MSLIESLAVAHGLTHPKQKFWCRMCNQSFSTRSNFAKHEVEIHFIDCSLCNSKFRNVNKLDDHILNQHTKLYPCTTQCGKKFCTLKKLNRHKKTHLPSKHHCNVCGKYYATKKVLRIHKLQHSGLRPYRCDLCSRTFQDPSAALRHQKTHNSKRHRFSCVECKRSFSRVDTLKGHLKTHSGKTHPCTFCTKVFKYRQSLHRHTKKLHLESSRICP